MPIYDFTFTPPQSSRPATLVSESQTTLIDDHPVRVPDLHEKKVDIAEIHTGSLNKSPEEVREVIVKGFYTLDEGMKNWLSGIKVPTKDSYKLATVHVVNQDRSILAWAQEFFDGRVPLPIISVKRDSWTFDPERFSPPYLPMDRVFTDNSGKRLRLVYRPLPFKVEYSVAVWCEFRQDAEYINTNIIRRCSPLGEFTVQDEYMSQIARVLHNSSTNSSDLDVSKDRPKIIYDMALTVEYAIPVNEKIVPTILGKVVTVKESDTREVFDVYRVEDFR